MIGAGTRRSGRLGFIHTDSDSPGTGVVGQHGRFIIDTHFQGPALSSREAHAGSALYDLGTHAKHQRVLGQAREHEAGRCNRTDLAVGVVDATAKSAAEIDFYIRVWRLFDTLTGGELFRTGDRATNLYAMCGGWASHTIQDTPEPVSEAASNASGLTPPRWLCRRTRL